MNKQRIVVLIVALATLSLIVAGCGGGAAAPTTPSAGSATPAAAGSPAVQATTGAAPIEAEAVAVTPDARQAVPAVVEGKRPLAELEPAKRNEAFSGPAPKYVQPDTVYLATIVTDKGNIVAELYQDTPESLNNFVTLALNGFYDGLTFHRVEPGFVVQGGDPAGSGMGGPGYTIPAEINHDHLRGALAWARTGDEINPERRSSGSQFYITLDKVDFLDGQYTVFGYVLEGMDVVDKIAEGDKIQRVDITKGGASRLPTPAPTPTPNAPSSEEGRPLASLGIAERGSVYNTAPQNALDTSKTYQATIETDKGNVVIDLDAKMAPVTVNNFITLANLGFYDNMPIAYSEPSSYLILGATDLQQGKDVGYLIEPEANVEMAQIVTGTVAMLPLEGKNGQPMSSGSLLVIGNTAIPAGSSNILGKVSSGQDVVAKLVEGDVIKQITITAK